MSEIAINNHYIANNNSRKSFKRRLVNIFKRDLTGSNKKRLLLNDIISYYLAFRGSAAPLIIEVETLNRCNSTCSFCPVNVHDESREYNKMSESLIEKIGDELEALDYEGFVSLYANNEPLLDERIVDVCRLLEKKLRKRI